MLGQQKSPTVPGVGQKRWDYHKVNDVLQFVAYPMPWNRQGSVGYDWQIPLSPETEAQPDPFCCIPHVECFGLN